MERIKSKLSDSRYQIIILFIFIILLYFKTFRYDYNLDDFIINDALDGKINSVKDLLTVFKMSYNHTDYRPIVFLSFAIEKLIFGTYSAAVSHGVNIILFIVISVLALQLFRLLFDKKQSVILFFGVLLFCVHPINTEVVSSIKCRDNLLSMLFSLLGIILIILVIQNKRKWYYLILSIFLLIIAALSKADALGWWLFIIAYLLTQWNSKQYKYLIFIPLGFLFSLNIIDNFFKKYFLNNAEEKIKGLVSITENPLALNNTFQNRIISFFNTIYYYLTKLMYVAPSKYYYGYNYYDILSIKTISFIGGILTFIVLIVILIYGIIRKNKLFTVPVIGIATLSFYALNFYQPVAGIIADRYIFMASLFFCLFISYLIFIFFEKRNKETFYIPTISSLIFFFCILSFLRISAWKDQKTLIDTDAPKLYSSYEAMRIAGATYFQEYEKEEDSILKKNYFDNSIFYLKKGIEVYPKNSLLYLFLGQYYFKNNDIENAITALKTSIINDTTKIDANIYLGDIYYSKNQLDSALIYYKYGLKIDSSSNQLINNISTVYFDLKQEDSCLYFNNTMIKKDANLIAPYENLGYFYLLQHDTTTAIKFFKDAVNKGLPANSIPIRII